MTLTEKVYNVLSGNSAITALCPADRILPPGAWQGMTRPYIIHFPTAIEPQRTQTYGEIGSRFWQIQVEVTADTFSQGDALCHVLMDEIGNYHDGAADFQLTNSPYYLGRDPDVNAEHFGLTFTVAESL